MWILSFGCVIKKDPQARLYQSPVILSGLLPKELLKEQGRRRPCGQGEALAAALRWRMLKVHVSPSRSLKSMPSTRSVSVLKVIS